MEKLFVFLLAGLLILPSATAFNCTALDGENKRVCNYVESQAWSQNEKDSIIQNLVDSGGSMDGDFVSVIGRPVPQIELNKLEDSEYKISEENKEFLIDCSYLGIFGYTLYSFFRKYHLLLNLI